MSANINVIELFAGVGGFRLGLEGYNGKSATSNYKNDLKPYYKVVWSNQWEPSTKVQRAADIYKERFGDIVNEDITTINVNDIPNCDMLVGGFPCQDYSVASTLKNSKGLIGKKGVLWWSIHNILENAKTPIKYLMLENVDRLLSSPSGQKGRDFAIILQSLNQLGYGVEWRIINAADYGFPQKRKRVFIMAYHKSTKLFRSLNEDWLQDGVLATAFPVYEVQKKQISNFKLPSDIVDISKNFNAKSNATPFENAGMMVNGIISTIRTIPDYNGVKTNLRDILQTGEIPKEFYIDNESLNRWEYLKGAKKEQRFTATGVEYEYSEGALSFPDDLDKPSRTIITGEGGTSAGRCKHVVNTDKGMRRLTPIELERLNMFPDDHTKFQKVSDTQRAFLMGNALVIGVVERIGEVLANKI